MRPDSSEDILYDDDEPTLPRAPSDPRISGARPAFQLDEDEGDTDVDGKILPADEEPTTAHLPPEVQQALRGISANTGDDTATAVTKPIPRVKRDGRN
jgi:hypothetical protein